ncbi:hypothetical protein [Dactylosporangium sp. CA-233914]|uniref:hypothetical protein n=1 Tax=Dactylosporangium sp. CA-233914 TaxID=3239934 RepID=UPI003D9193F8
MQRRVQRGDERLAPAQRPRGVAPAQRRHDRDRLLGALPGHGQVYVLDVDLPAVLRRVHPAVLPGIVALHGLRRHASCLPSRRHGRQARGGTVDVVTLAEEAQEALSRAQAGGDVVLLQRAIELYRTLLSQTPAGHESRPIRLTGLAAALASRFELAGDPADLEAAVRLGWRARRLLSPGDEDAALVHSNLGAALATRFTEHYHGRDLEAAIAELRAAVAAAAPGDPYLSSYRSNLGAALELAYSVAGADTLDEAVECARLAAEDVPPDAPADAIAGYRANLANVLLVRFRRRGRPGDLDDAVEQYDRLCAEVPAEHPIRPEMVARAGDAWALAYLHRGRPQALDRAVDLHREAHESTRAADAQYYSSAEKLATTLRMRFEHAGRAADLDEAETLARRALSGGGPDRPERLATLATVLHSRYEHGNDPGALDAAIDAYRAAADATPPQDLQRAYRLSNLAEALRLRLLDRGGFADLESAVAAARAALDEVPPEHSERAMFAAHLANILHARWSRLGTAGDLDAAIELARAAAAGTAEDNVTAAARLANLAELLLARALDRRGERPDGDLDAAIELAPAAAADTAEDNVTAAARLPNLAELLPARALDRRGERPDAGLDGDLGAALAAARAADASAAPRSDRAAIRSSLGNVLTVAYGRDHDPATIEAAIRAHRGALAASGPPGRPGRIGNLAAAWAQRWFVGRDPGDLRRAIVGARQAAAAAAPGSPARATQLSGLAVLLRDRGDRRRAQRAAREAADIRAAPVAVRLGARTIDAELSMAARESPAAATAYAEAVALLPQAAWRGGDRRTRQTHLVRWAGLSGEGAAAAVAGERPGLALELLEGGRAVLWSQRLQLRTRDERLARVAPAVAARLDELRAALDDERF